MIVVKLFNYFHRSGAQYVTLPTALPILVAQTAKLSMSERDLPGIYTMKETLKNALEYRFDLSKEVDLDMDDEEVALIACFFDPRFKVRFQSNNRMMKILFIYISRGCFFSTKIDVKLSKFT